MTAVPEGVSDKEAWDLIVKARTHLLLSHPFWGSLHMRVPFKEDVEAQTLWINGVEQGYNPEWIKSHPTMETKTALAHEACHVLLLHHLRRGNRPHEEWNICCDYAVNGILVKAGFHLPEGWMYDPQYDGKSAEQIFEERRGKEQPPQPPEPQPQKPDKNEDEEGENEQGGEGEGDEESTGGDPGGAGEVRDMPTESGEISQSDIDKAEAEMKIAVTQAETQHESFAGAMPGGMKRFIKNYVSPKIPIDRIIMRFVQQSAKDDYSWKRLNRRYIWQDMIVPTLTSASLEDIVVIIDSSGSQNDDNLRDCGSVITDLLAAFPAHLIVLYVDTAVAGVEEFTSDDLPVTLHGAGGGGTDFKPGFKWIEDHEVYPTCVLYLTDGECSSYPTEPDYPVLWIGTKRSFKVPFGELYMINEY